jgi:hypothetical protein
MIRDLFRRSARDRPADHPYREARASLAPIQTESYEVCAEDLVSHKVQVVERGITSHREAMRLVTVLDKNAAGRGIAVHHWCRPAS